MLKQRDCGTLPSVVPLEVTRKTVMGQPAVSIVKLSVDDGSLWVPCIVECHGHFVLRISGGPMSYRAAVDTPAI